MPEYIEKGAFFRAYGPCSPKAFERPEYAKGWNALHRAVKAFPAADAAPVRYGVWIDDNYGYNHCTECGYEFDRPEEKTPYCPHCGARMNLEVHNETNL